MSTILGTTLNGRYRLEARIGSGGMSTVYRALDETLQRQVAIKLMNREVATDSDQLKRFRREARDRKSTRLNSSHVEISYAVFCLKKKKKTLIGLHPSINKKTMQH